MSSFFPFILQASILFPSKKSLSKVAPFQIYGHMSTWGKSIFDKISYVETKKTTFKQWKRHDASSTG